MERRQLSLLLLLAALALGVTLFLPWVSPPNFADTDLYFSGWSGPGLVASGFLAALVWWEALVLGDNLRVSGDPRTISSVLAGSAGLLAIADVPYLRWAGVTSTTHSDLHLRYGSWLAIGFGTVLVALALLASVTPASASSSDSRAEGDGFEN